MTIFGSVWNVVSNINSMCLIVLLSQAIALAIVFA